MSLELVRLIKKASADESFDPGEKVKGTIKSSEGIARDVEIREKREENNGTVRSDHNQRKAKGSWMMCQKT
jgi:hypothetical protein